MIPAISPAATLRIASLAASGSPAGMASLMISSALRPSTVNQIAIENVPPRSCAMTVSSMRNPESRSPAFIASAEQPSGNAAVEPTRKDGWAGERDPVWPSNCFSAAVLASIPSIIFYILLWRWLA